MKNSVLVLLVLLFLLSAVQSMAQAPAPASNRAAVPVSDADARFLAALSGGEAQTPSDLVPAPSFMTGCTSTSQCPTGQLCCWVCGNPPAEDDGTICRACVTPVKGRCPMVV